MRDVEHRLDLGRVPGLEHRHVRRRPHDGDVLDGLVRHAPGGGDARQEADEADLQVRVRDRHRQLVVGAPVDEDREGVDVGHVPLAREPGGETHHVLLGHAEGEEAVGVGVAPPPHLAAVGEVRGQDHDLGLVGGPGDEVVDVGAVDDLHGYRHISS